MEKQQVAARDGLNRDTGGVWLAFRSAAKGVFINVYRHNGDFVARQPSGNFPAIKVAPAIQHRLSAQGASRSNSLKALITHYKRRGTTKIRS